MKTPADAKWIKAEKGEGLSIVFYDKQGNKMTRRKDPTSGSLLGSKAWRHNNPGNLSIGPHSRQYGAIGSASYTITDENGKERTYTFAIFPSYEVGRSAMMALLKSSRYIELTLDELPRKYTGVEDGKPDTKEAIEYRNFLKKSTNLDLNRTLESLNPDEFNMLISKMENYEGWHPWEEGELYEPIQKIVAVKMHNHCITNFLVLDQFEKNWISREQAIELAENQKLRAVVVHRSKQVYLRPFPHETPFKDMVC